MRNTLPSTLLLLTQLSTSIHGLAINYESKHNIQRRDASSQVRRTSSLSKRQNTDVAAGAPGLRLPIELAQDHRSYHANVSIGTPEQQLSLSLGMEGVTWVPTLPAGVDSETFCSSERNVKACEYAVRSNFYTIPGSVTYLPQGDRGDVDVDGLGDTVSGVEATERITIAGAILDNVAFTVAHDWNTAPRLSLSVGEPSQILEVMQSQNLINSLAYSLAFGSRQGNATDYSTGSVIFGGIEEDGFYGELNTFNSTNTTIVGAVPVSNLYLQIAGDKEEGNKNVSVIPEETEAKAGDLGVGQISLTPFIYVQDAMFEILISMWKGMERVNSTRDYLYNCSAPTPFESLQLSIDGGIITIPASDFLIPSIAEEELCTLALLPMASYGGETTADYILGLPFLRQAYTIIDHTNSQTHIAPRRLSNNTSPAIIPLSATGGLIAITGPTRLSTTILPVSTTLSVPFITNTPPPSATTSAAPAPTQTIYNINTPTSKSVPVGAIVGAVVGVIVLLAAVIVFYPLKKMKTERDAQRDRRKKREGDRADSPGGSGALSPTNSRNQAGGAADGDRDEDDEDDEKDSEAINTAIAMSTSKGDQVMGPRTERNASVVAERGSIGLAIGTLGQQHHEKMPGQDEKEGTEGGRDSVTVNVTELGSSRCGSPGDSEGGQSAGTFGESEISSTVVGSNDGRSTRVRNPWDR